MCEQIIYWVFCYGLGIYVGHSGLMQHQEAFLYIYFLGYALQFVLSYIKDVKKTKRFKEITMIFIVVMCGYVKFIAELLIITFLFSELLKMNFYNTFIYISIYILYRENAKRLKEDKK